MITENQLAAQRDLIAEADPKELSRIFADVLHRLGEHGRPAAEALLERLQVRQLDAPDDPYIEEGLAQLEAVEGVLSGRTDAL